MSLFNELFPGTCSFFIHTKYNGHFLSQDYGSGRKGHLNRYGKSRNPQYQKFLIYPEPGKPEQFRMVLMGFPKLYVQFENPGRARLVSKANTDLQLFRFLKTGAPARFPADAPSDVQWYNIEGVGLKKVFVFKSINYVEPGVNTREDAKFWFESVDLVDVDKKIQLVPAQDATRDGEAPKDFDEATYGLDEWSRRLVSREAIPAALINDNYPVKSDQIRENPYYILEWEKLWSASAPDLKTIALSDDHATVIDVEYTTSYSQEDFKSLERTVGHTFTTEVQLAYGGGPVPAPSGYVKMTYQFATQTKSLESQRITSGQITKSKKTETFKQLENGEKYSNRSWQPVDRYTLTDRNGELIGKWMRYDTDAPYYQKVRR